jgi:opine dehydrogenase
MSRAAVMGSGPGGLAIAAELSERGYVVSLADLPAFSHQLEVVRDRGGVIIDSNWSGDVMRSVVVADSIAAAVSEAELVVISVPAVAHELFIEAIVPDLQHGATLLFVGEGGGCLVAWPELLHIGRDDVLLGETNCLPYMARPTGQGRVLANRKQGGVLVAAMPAARGPELFAVASSLWPYAEQAETVWETALINYDAIDTVPVAVTSAAKLEGRSGGVLFWGEGATESVVRLIEALDDELLALRHALGHSDHRRYRDFLIAQGLAPDSGDLYHVMRAGGITRSYRPSGDLTALRDRLALEVGYCLVLASSLGAAIGVDTPVIDGHIAVSDALLQRSFRAEGRTLARLGLSDLDADRLTRYVRTGSLDP